MDDYNISILVRAMSLLIQVRSSGMIDGTTTELKEEIQRFLLQVERTGHLNQDGWVE